MKRPYLWMITPSGAYCIRKCRYLNIALIRARKLRDNMYLYVISDRVGSSFILVR